MIKSSEPNMDDIFYAILTIALAIFIMAVLHRAIKSNEKTVAAEEKYITNKCKPLSYSAVASPTLSSRPLSIYLCRDGDIQTYFVAKTKAK
jgi:hypothetical protein